MSVGDIEAAAKARFAQIPFPHKKDEYWRFADLPAWGADGLFPFFSSSRPPEGEPCAAVRGMEKSALNCDIVLLDGAAVSASAPAGVEIMQMAAAYEKYPRLLEEFFASASGKLDVFQASRASGGVFVRVRENAEAGLSVAAISKSHISACGAYFLLERGAKLRLSKTSLGFGGSLGASRFGFNLGEGAVLEYAQRKYSERAAQMFEREDFYTAPRARIIDAMSQEGLAPSRSERNFYINGEGVEVDSRVFLRPRGNITADLRTRQIHSAPASKSNLQVKAAIADTAAIAFTGLIDVCESAQKTEAYQSCRSVLLSPEAKSQASPILEICANDVLCSHGCTVAEPDKEQLFYMRSRGLSLETAREMLVESFANSTFEHVGDI